MIEFNIKEFDEKYTKDKANTILELSNFINEMQAKYEEQEKKLTEIKEKNTMLVESNSKLFLNQATSKDKPKEPIEEEKDKESIINEIIKKIKGEE